MFESYPLKELFFTDSEQNRFTIRFEKADLFLDMPGLSLKSWYVAVEGLDANSANRLSDCYYYGNPVVTLTMETPGGKNLRGEVLIGSISVGPRSKARMNGRGLLEGVEAFC